jgi:hypothetical protein
MKRTLETASVFFEMEDKILVITYLPTPRVTLKQAKEIVAERLVFTENKSMPLLIQNQGIVKMDKDARDYLSSDAGIAGIKCAAILVNSNFTSLTVTFFLKITKPKLLVKTFTEKKEALTWLSNYID